MYKNAHRFSFKKFIARLQNSYYKLEVNSRKVHNGYIVDVLWGCIEISGIKTYLASLKVK